MKRFVFSPRGILFLLLAALAFVAAGCSSVEPENTSARPWNSPKGWETGGLPTYMNEGH